ncbi:MAG: hypothetical protein ACTHMC_00025, partial [Pseudobacter sp.]|uniref:hypothetical protein n=1 Tax=Pseudobacter sp. TaxID=2045420 RepID=UPI003F818F02
TVGSSNESPEEKYGDQNPELGPFCWLTHEQSIDLKRFFKNNSFLSSTARIAFNNYNLTNHQCM